MSGIFIFINSLCGAFKLSNQFCVACTGQIISDSPKIRRIRTASSVMHEILSFFSFRYLILDDLIKMILHCFIRKNTELLPWEKYYQAILSK